MSRRGAALEGLDDDHAAAAAGTWTGRDLRRAVITAARLVGVRLWGGHLEQLTGAGDVLGAPAIAALALLDPDHHPGAVDVLDLERDDLGGAQARAIGDAQRRLVLEAGRRIEEPRHLLRA